MIELLKTTEAVWGVLLAVIALAIAAYQLYQSNRIRKHEFEDIYVQRYWQIMDQLDSRQKQSLYKADEAQVLATDENAREALWKFLELCEDQADLRAVNMVTTSTWSQWHGGVRKAASRPPFAGVLDAFLESLDGEGKPPFERLQEARACEGFYDPRPPWWRRILESTQRAFEFAVGRKLSQ